MTTSNLLNVPSSPESWAWFSFSNQDSHIKIVRRAFQVLKVKLQEFPLDPMPLQDLGAWAYQHQQAHDQMNAVLGIAGNDFTALDLEAPDQVSSWIRNHFENHLQASDILKLT